MKLSSLKQIAVLLFVGLTAAPQSFAQQIEKYPAPVIVKTQVVDASATDTWKIISQFDNLAELVPTFLHDVSIEGEIAEGCVRTCNAADQKSYYKEKITYFNEKEMYYRYGLIESMLPVQNMENSFRVLPLGKNKSLVIWTTGYEFVENPTMPEEKMKGFINASLNEMLSNVSKTASEG